MNHKSINHESEQNTERVNEVHKAMPAYAVLRKRQGEYTLEDYYALPDDIRAELIDGELIFLEAPSSIHQELIGELFFEIKLYIRTNNGPCKILPSPLDVQLDCDNRTMLQPDISVICHRDRIVKKGIYGAPDLCIEIVSPSSRKRDYEKKRMKYQNAGVREYWIVDPKTESVLCYFFEKVASLILILSTIRSLYGSMTTIWSSILQKLRSGLSKPLPDDFSLIVLIIPEHSC